VNRPKISRLRQTLTRDSPIHPKPILYHENIRVSFLWTMLWGVSQASRLHALMVQDGGLRVQDGNKGKPDSL
jgi:hypothetical protein